MESTLTNQNQEMADEHQLPGAGTINTNETPDPLTMPAMNDLSRYEITERLGNGAHGVVMKAKDTLETKFYAIKFTYNKGGNLLEFQRALEAFDRENQDHIKELNHKGVIKLFAWSPAP